MKTENYKTGIVLCGIGAFLSLLLPWVKEAWRGEGITLYEIALGIIQGKTTDVESIFPILALIAAIVGLFASLGFKKEGGTVLTTVVAYSLAAVFSLLFMSQIKEEYGSFARKGTGYYLSFILFLLAAGLAGICLVKRKMTDPGANHTGTREEKNWVDSKPQGTESLKKACLGCGKEVSKESVFCPFCGDRIVKEQSSNNECTIEWTQFLDMLNKCPTLEEKKELFHANMNALDPEKRAKLRTVIGAAQDLETYDFLMRRLF